MSLQSLLSIARSALGTHQRAMDVTGHNVANANTPGYTRQRLVLAAATPLQTPLFPLGRGVDAVAIQRSRDTFYDSSFRDQNGQLGRFNTMGDYLSRIESSMNEPSSTGIAAGLDQLFKSFSDLANDPANHTNRELVVSAANRLTGQLHQLDANIGTVRQEAFDNLNTQVADVNAIAKQIAQLNTQIQATGGPGHVSPDLMDQRDNLVDKLSGMIGVTVVPHADGSIGVVAGDTLLVDGANTTTLSVGSAGAGWGIFPAGGGQQVDAKSGSLKGLTDLTQTTLPGLQGKLDSLAASLVSQFNALHRTGTTLGGATNVDFFDPAATTAGSIRLSAQVLASSDNIAASANGAAGNGGIAAQLAALSSSPVAALGNKTFREFYVGVAAGVGLDVRSAQQDGDVQQALVDRSSQARDAVSGVNIDEEMINLIGEQQAYQAAARLVTIADQMMQQILQIT